MNKQSVKPPFQVDMVIIANQQSNVDDSESDSDDDDDDVDGDSSSDDSKTDNDVDKNTFSDIKSRFSEIKSVHRQMNGSQDSRRPPATIFVNMYQDLKKEINKNNWPSNSRLCLIVDRQDERDKINRRDRKS
eukprot:344082_1